MFCNSDGDPIVGSVNLNIWRVIKNSKHTNCNLFTQCVGNYRNDSYVFTGMYVPKMSFWTVLATLKQLDMSLSPG